MSFRSRRIYEPPGGEDGYRVLVDRLWPRGVRKEEAQLDEWLKEIAPSDELRRWFGHDPERWAEFRRRYRRELEARTELIGRLLTRGEQGTVTLLYAARDQRFNHAAALLEYLLERRQRGGSGGV